MCRSGEKSLAIENTGIARPGKSPGEVAPGRSGNVIARTWLDTLIGKAVQHPELSIFAPFQEYFVDQKPIEDQLSGFLESEIVSLIPGETRMTAFRLVLADRLSEPEAFIIQRGDRSVISDLYQVLFNWLANADVLPALDVARKIVRNPRCAEISLLDSRPLPLFLFRALNARIDSKVCGDSFYRAVFQFALDAPDAVAADIPDIVEANIRAFGDDHDRLHRLFSEYSVLRTAYRRYLSSHYPELLEKYELRFMNRIRAALPRGFSVCLEAPDIPDTQAIEPD